MSSSPTTALQPSAPPATSKAPIRSPAFIIEWEPWWISFAHNLAGIFQRQQKFQTRTPPAAFWPDVFVGHGLPRRGLAISAVYHAAALSILYALPVLLLLASRLPRENPAPRAPLTFYQVSEYLPPVIPAPAASRPARHLHSAPQLARQTVISVHQRADNNQQTVIDPDSVKVAQLPRPAPNLFVTRGMPAVPTAAIPQAASSQRLVLPTAPVHMPAPQVPASSTAAINFPAAHVPAVVDPAPALDSVPSGAINMALAKVDVVPPQLPVPQQQAASANSKPDLPKPSAVPSPPVPPPPMIAAGSEAGSAGQRTLIALNLHPELPQGPVEVPEGNRNGDFAATPAGDPRANGTPSDANITEGQSAGNSKPAAAPEIPGIFIAAAGENPVAALASQVPTIQAPESTRSAPIPEAASQSVPLSDKRPSSGMAHTSPRLLASMTPPRVSDLARRPVPSEPGVAADTFFAGKKYYSLVLNMPNLTSAGGSWVIRFAELTRQQVSGDLTAPVAVDKVDPAYPPQLIRDQVQGIVTLYAVIRSDGSVAEVRVLQGINNLLDENARIALSQWRFRPATRNGAAVDLEAVVQIPFKLRKLPF